MVLKRSLKHYKNWFYTIFVIIVCRTFMVVAAFQSKATALLSTLVSNLQILLFSSSFTNHLLVLCWLPLTSCLAESVQVLYSNSARSNVNKDCQKSRPAATMTASSATQSPAEQRLVHSGGGQAKNTTGTCCYWLNKLELMGGHRALPPLTHNPYTHTHKRWHRQAYCDASLESEI